VWDPNKFISVLKSFLATDGKIIIFENNPLNPLFYPLFVLTGNLRSHLTKEYFNATIYSLRKFIRQNGLVTERIVRYAFLPTVLYNYSSVFITVNRVLNSLPIINHFCAFHIVICKKTKNGKTVSR
jgi:hypothetical protein